MPPTVADVFEDLRTTIETEPRRVKGVSARYQFHITGEGGGDWTMVIDDGTAQIADGQIEDPQTTVTMDAPDFIAMCVGELDGTDAFMTGKLKVAGDPFLGMRLAEIMKRDD
ncbi:MAG: SCP2 sterol-binding domain-containing protein [Candidatus Dormibacteraeota bacterium]|nr:SCP2 sterol-binding domain-containing protein [Candidatus Dormibacteraeota bacterium]MBV9526537.1 SCP2 sterol-binding domain-containing protein [Candidatus Dormibacteraeota bacterium]